ncbi:hypothetical protein EAE99_010057 [Botrytis elliptica]|nr:hypothetical protein EAE99_010057 [Botrytis elliptica]
MSRRRATKKIAYIHCLIPRKYNMQKLLSMQESITIPTHHIVCWSSHSWSSVIAVLVEMAGDMMERRVVLLIPGACPAARKKFAYLVFAAAAGA